MMEKWTDAISGWLIQNEVIEKEEREVYQYALYSAFISLFPLLMAMGFGMALGCVKQSILIVLPFAVIRKFSGGYHAKHAAVCLISSCMLLYLCLLLSFHVRSGWMLLCLTAGAGISLSCLSPIENENRLLDEAERSCYKRITRNLVLFFLLIAFLCSVFGFSQYGVCISIGLLLAAGLQLPFLWSVFKKTIFSKKQKNIDQTKQENVVWCKRD